MSMQIEGSGAVIIVLGLILVGFYTVGQWGYSLINKFKIEHIRMGVVRDFFAHVDTYKNLYYPRMVKLFLLCNGVTLFSLAIDHPNLKEIVLIVNIGAPITVIVAMLLGWLESREKKY